MADAVALAMRFAHSFADTIESCGENLRLANMKAIVLEVEALMFTRIRDSHPRSITKAITWRITGSVDTFVLSFIFTGSVKLAGSIVGVELATKTVLYYLHETAWSAIRWAQRGQIGNQSNST